MEELLLVGCYNGPEVKIYRHVFDAAGASAFENLDRGPLPPLNSPDTCERVVLFIDEKQQCGCHFSKLLTDTAWSALRLAHHEHSESCSASSASRRSTASGPCERHPHAVPRGRGVASVAWLGVRDLLMLVWF